MDGVVDYPIDSFRRVELMVFDVDGVLTDGKIVYSSSGEDTKSFDVQDGLGLSLLVRAGIKVAFMSAKGSRTISRRAQDCGVEIVLEHVDNKRLALERLSEELGVPLDRIGFVGDDLVDIRPMRICGLPIAVANACEEVKSVASYVTKKRGGAGAVREIAELVLKAKGLWERIVESFYV